MWSQWEFNYQVRKALHLWGWSNGTSFSLLCMCQCAHIHIYVFLYVSSALKQIHWYLYWLIQNIFHQAWLYRCFFFISFLYVTRKTLSHPLFHTQADIRYLIFRRASGAMANASPDLDNAEAQRQLNNNNRPIGSGFWETECTSSKLFECSRIKALAGQRSQADQCTCLLTFTQIQTLQTFDRIICSYTKWIIPTFRAFLNN